MRLYFPRPQLPTAGNPQLPTAGNHYREYIKPEGDFHKEVHSCKDQYGRDKTGEQSEKTANCRENLWNEIQLKGP